MPRLMRLTGVLAALLAVIPAHAQVYKWVDEQGVTNYSSEPPADRKGGPKPAIVTDRISVYAPEPGIQRAIRAVSLGKDRILSDRIDSLEREQAAERQASEFAAAAEARAAQAAYAQCQADRRVDCDYNSGYYPYGLGGVLTVVHRRAQPRNPAVAHSRGGAEHIARLHSGGKGRQPGVFPP
jgi:uncharacterized protein DUF4124